MTRYEITVYQLGWRLGGKGASKGNAGHGSRIEVDSTVRTSGPGSTRMHSGSCKRVLRPELQRPPQEPAGNRRPCVPTTRPFHARRVHCRALAPLEPPDAPETGGTRR